MAKGKHEAPSKGRRVASVSRSRRRRRSGVKLLPLAAALVLAIGMVAGSTMAYLTAESDALIDTYTAGVVTCEAQSDYTVKNTGNVDAYIRVKLVQNYVDAQGNVCSMHQPPVPATMSGWIFEGDYYYYHQKLTPGSVTDPVASSNATEADDKCTVQTILIAGAIQAEPAETVTEAWDYTPGV